jgi:tRNA-binding protein
MPSNKPRFRKTPSYDRLCCVCVPSRPGSSRRASQPKPIGSGSLQPRRRHWSMCPHRSCSRGLRRAVSMNHFAPAPTKPIIAIADLDKLDIRVGMIESVEFVAGSDKLVKLTVEFGDRRRSVLAGLRNERADPKVELEGRQALFVVNLAPRKMAGQGIRGDAPGHRLRRWHQPSPSNPGAADTEWGASGLKPRARIPPTVPAARAIGSK